jgi:hypothetical protein
MNDQTRPDVAHLAATMAANHAKVVQYARTLSDRIDNLVEATVRRDWGEVRRISQQLTDDGRSCGYRAVSALAQRVCDELDKPGNEIGVKRSLIRLIGICSRTGTRLPLQATL